MQFFGGSMYAVLRTGGKQYKVHPGDTIRVEKLEAQVGSEIVIKDILLVGGDSLSVGAPLVSGAEVAAIVTKQAKFPKVIIFKKKRRQGYRRTKGHRQSFTELFIKSVALDGNKSEASQLPTFEANSEEVPQTAVKKTTRKKTTEPAKEAKVAKKVTSKAKAPAKKAASTKKTTAASATKKKTTSKKVASKA